MTQKAHSPYFDLQNEMSHALILHSCVYAKELHFVARKRVLFLKNYPEYDLVLDEVFLNEPILMSRK